jgi:class 3 adenylate cyclase
VPVHPVEHKLAAIFAADIAGYSRLMARDEVDTLARLNACRAIIDQLIKAHRAASSIRRATASSVNWKSQQCGASRPLPPARKKLRGLPEKWCR